MVDVLVVLLDSSQHHIVPQKLYNYLGLNKPILAVVSPDGCAANVVRETNTGIVVSPDNIDDVANGLLQLHKQWQKGLLRFEAKDASLQKYRRDQLTKKLAGIFEKLTLKQNAVLIA